MDWIHAIHPPPPQIHIGWDLTPTVIVFGGKVSVRWLGHESRTPMNGLASSLMKETPQREDNLLLTRKLVVTRHWICWHLSLGLSSLQNCEEWISVVYKPPCILLLLSCFSHVRLCVTPQTAAHQAPPSLGFSRQEHWSGLPFPSPMCESESEVAQSCPTRSDRWTEAYQAPPSMGFFRQEYWSGVPLPSPMYLVIEARWLRYSPKAAVFL